MSKRRSEVGQLRREEYEALEEGDSADPGQFRRASSAKIQARRIVKARRPIRGQSGSLNLQSNESKISKSINPFSGFNGFNGKDANTEKSSSTTNPFSGFTGLSGKDSNSEKKSSSPSNTITGYTGLSESNTSISKPAVKNPFTGFSGLTQIQPIPETRNNYSPGGTQSNHSIVIGNGPNIPSSSTFSNHEIGSCSYEEAISKLNKQFADWTKHQIHENPTSLWTEAIQDYLKHSQEIQKKCGEPKKKSISFATPKDSSKEHEISTSSFQHKSINPSNEISSQVSSSAKSSPPLFTSFKLPEPNNKSFMIESTNNSTTSIEEDSIGREEATVILKAESTNEDMSYILEKVKLFEFKAEENRWVDKGTHPLKILRNKSTNRSRILIRNSIGKVVLNASLYKGMKSSVRENKGKKQGVLVNLFMDNVPTRFLIRAKEDLVESLHNAIKEASR